MVTNAASLAARFLDIAAESNVEVSNLKLQKLVALAESLSLYARHKSAFVETVQAWRNGPVIKPLYKLYSEFGDRPITEVRGRSTKDLSEDLEFIVQEVWGIAGHLPPGGLWKLTHETGPYEAHYVDGVHDIVIPSDELGAAWPDYVAMAAQLTAYRSAAATPVLGDGQRGFDSDDDYRAAAEEFRPSSARRVG